MISLDPWLPGDLQSCYLFPAARLLSVFKEKTSSNRLHLVGESLSELQCSGS